jgi:hypothetical protein
LSHLRLRVRYLKLGWRETPLIIVRSLALLAFLFVYSSRWSLSTAFNHVVGLPQKDKREYPLFDYEKLLYDALMHPSSSPSVDDLSNVADAMDK